MILLDTNYMIALVSRELDAIESVRRWLEEGEEMATSSAAWSEFCTGPLESDDRVLMESLFEDRIVAFGRTEAEYAARLYRQARCKRGDRLDTFIAATAIVSAAALATRDKRGFSRFVPLGLRLA
jgi:predicted nucleic acid-binding protein